ncbi:MAG TPA: hypothetical protein VNF07_07460 [Acidimicrobiales bacterium]|nr:hypothetical protein [Acidimicrobiales bacterium]
MPLFDKIKAQAAQVAQMAQDAGKAGQAKLDQVQSKRQLDALYRDLGAAVYAERNGDAAAGAEVTRLVGEITDHIAANPAPDEDATTVTPGSGEPPAGGAPKATYGS